jgi:hypothetical protein
LFFPIFFARLEKYKCGIIDGTTLLKSSLHQQWEIKKGYVKTKPRPLIKTKMNFNYEVFTNSKLKKENGFSCGNRLELH